VFSNNETEGIISITFYIDLNHFFYTLMILLIAMYNCCIIVPMNIYLIHAYMYIIILFYTLNFDPKLKT